MEDNLGNEEQGEDKNMPERKDKNRLESDPEQMMEPEKEKLKEKAKDKAKDEDKCPHCLKNSNPEDDYCQNCGYPPSGFQHETMKEELKLESTSKIEDIKIPTENKDENKENQDVEKTKDINDEILFEDLDDLDEIDFKNETQQDAEDMFNERAIQENLDLKNVQKENETTPEIKTVKRNGFEESSKARKKVDYGEKCSSKTCQREIEKLKEQSEEDKHQILSLDKALNDGGMVRKLNMLEDEIEDHVKSKKFKDCTINRQNAQIVELNSELENERELRMKAQKQREEFYKETAKKRKIDKEKMKEMVKQYGIVITEYSDEFALIEKLNAKCQVNNESPPKEYFLMEDEEGTEIIKVIGLIEEKKETKEERCMVCKSRFYAKFTGSKREPSYGVMIDVKKFSIAKLGPIESAHFGKKGLKKIGYVEGYFP